MPKFDANWWELYNVEGADTAASNLQTALKFHCNVTCSKMGHHLWYTSQKAANEVYTNMLDELSKHRKVGAMDTEPRAVLACFLRDKFGVEVER